MCFSYDDPDSLSAVADNWVKEVSHHCHVPTPYFLVGLKSDLPRKITDDQVQSMIKDKTCSEAFTVSAKDGTGTKELFDAIAKASVSNFKQSQKSNDKAPADNPAGNAPANPKTGPAGGPKKRNCVIF